jgi:pilus assembly protein CpaB
MRTRTLIVLLGALLSGAIAGYAALQLLSNRTAPLQAAEPTESFQVVIAAREKAVGDLIGPEDVRLVDWPSNAVPEGYSRAIADVVGRGVIAPLKTNEPLLEVNLAPRGAGGGLPVLIPEGMRALSIRVDEVVAVAGYVIKGTRVDLLLTTQPPGMTEQVTKTLLQNIEVGGAGQVITRDEEGKPISASVVTFFVTPDEAEQVTLATKSGQIQLALRNAMDVKEAKTAGARTSRLLSMGTPSPVSGRRPARPVPTQDPGQTLEVIKGGTRALIRFGSGRSQF